MILRWFRRLRRIKTQTAYRGYASASAERPAGWVLDMRGWSSLKEGHVHEAVIVDVETWEEERPFDSEPGPVYVMADSPDVGCAVVAQLNARGRTAHWVAGLAEMREAGWPECVPHEKSPVRVGQLVFVDPEHVPNQDRAAKGRVQEVSWGDLDFIYTVRVHRTDGTVVRLANLPEEALTAQEGRGLPD